MIYIATLEVDNEALLEGKICITTIRELYECILQPDATELIIEKTFAEEYFTPSGLQLFIDNTQSINSKISITVNSMVSLFNDKAVHDLKSINSMEQFMYILHSKPKETIDTIRSLCDYYLGITSETLVANDKISTLHLQNTHLQKKYQDVKEDYDKLMDIKNEYEAKLRTLVSRINFRYNKDLNQDTMFHVEGNSYDKILYVKEITRVHFTDTLLYYLQEILKTFYGVPARFVVIEPYYAYNNVKMYDNCKPHYELTYSDVYKENIFMAGLQPRLMEDILNNPLNVNYLIILDRSGYKNPYVSGDNVETVYCASDLDDAETYHVPMDRVISYSESSMYIPFIAGFSILSTEARIQRYSSMEIMKKLLDLIERK
jgi:hypothetical protein